MSEPLRASLLLALLLGCAFTGCGGSADSGVPINDRSSIVGTWTARSITDGTTTQTCPATVNDPPGATSLNGPINCTGTETFVFYKDGKCRMDGSPPFFSYSTKVNTTTGATEYETSHCPPSNLEIPCQTFSGVVDLPHNTLILHRALRGKVYVDVAYQRSFAGG